jgi:hypothetical protein
VIKISLYRDQLGKMHHDKSLEDFYPANNTSVQTTMNEEQFDDFCKVNNLILYRHQLKNYQDGVVWGEISVV